MTTIDCRNLECPKPVIMTKNALDSLSEGESLEILVNALAPKENISRFLKNTGYNHSFFRKMGTKLFTLIIKIYSF